MSKRYRKEEKDFTRERVLTFSRVVVLILSGHKLSLQNGLNKVFKALGKVFEVPTASAYCQARQKIKAEVFVALNQSVVADFYELYGAENQVERWHGHRLLGADGTYLNLPDTPALRKAFSVHRNQRPKEKQATVQALGMVLYDLRNDIGVRGGLAPSHSAEKNILFEQLWGELEGGDVLVLDRQSADYTIIAQAVKANIGVVIRCPRQSFKVVKDFFASTQRERLVTLSVPQSRRTQKYVREHELPETVAVRLLKFKLETGEEEVLLTTLCDQKKYPRQEFYEVYGWRWGDETYYDRLKNIFEVERFSGNCEESIKQEFYGVIFLATLESVLSQETESALQAAAVERQTKTVPQVNHAVSYVALSAEVANLLGNRQQSVPDILRELRHLFRQTPTRLRNGRKYPREKSSAAIQLRYHRYRKRVLA